MTKYDANAQDMADALYTGGWRAEDRADLLEEYDLTEEDVDVICELLAEYAVLNASDEWTKRWAETLFEVGWRAEDRAELMEAYDEMNEEEADEICGLLAVYNS